ncbi:MAG: hypothetical protein GXP31_11165 [Kiritimatiellaeota bacterium]|nr:hypothetical protein [Kiritimatiellota bacterium]
MTNLIDRKILDAALTLLGRRLQLEGIGPFILVACGGSALIARNLVPRTTTKDLDVVALADDKGGLLDPEPLPTDLLVAAEQTRLDLGLPDNWLNNGPSRGDGGLYRAGLPPGLLNRAEKRTYGKRLTVHFIGRLDQIYFKLPAAVDQGGGRHLEDLLALKPTAKELEDGARWARTYDPSEGFAWLLRELLRKMGHDAVADRI